jgi:hypothetical protein
MVIVVVKLAGLLKSCSVPKVASRLVVTVPVNPLGNVIFNSCNTGDNIPNRGSGPCF